MYEYGCFSFETLMPIVDIHALDANYTSGGRGMQELAVPEVDADVWERPIQGIEENEIARHQLLFADLVSGFGHLAGSSG